MPKKVEQKQRVGLATLAAIADGRQLLPDVKGTFIPSGRKYPLVDHAAQWELNVPMLAWQSRVLDALYCADPVFGFIFDHSALTLVSITNFRATGIDDLVESEMLFTKELESECVELKFSQNISSSDTASNGLYIRYYVEVTVKDKDNAIAAWSTACCRGNSMHIPPMELNEPARSMILDTLVRFGLIF